jgi:thioredoxin reductase
VLTDEALGTSLPGLFAAGDARAGASRTLVSAIEDGRKAAASARAIISPLGNTPE